MLKCLELKVDTFSQITKNKEVSIPFFQVDTFTSTLFKGNPAGVCILADWPPDNLLQSIAAENNLAETAFVVQRSSFFELRWFTPVTEMDLCGHATLASAHVVFRHLGFRNSTIRFESRSGLLTVGIDNQMLTLDFPSRPAATCEAPPDLASGLGVSPIHVAKSRDYLAVFETEQAVRLLRPDMSVLMGLDCLGIIVTAPGDDCDFISRFFAPRAGITEDPVTGSAHCTLIPYWSQRLGRSALRARQISPRGGELFCEDRGERVSIGGHAITYSSGFLHCDLR
ncbi:MAG: PhzF family phenazine biosynthesis protein [Nibricoccus sp.]